MPSPVATLTSTVRRVDLDIAVTDWNGHPVSGLTKDDFKVQEDKVPQVVRSFDVYSAPPGTANAAAGLALLPSNTFLNAPRVPEQGTPTVILFNALNDLFAEDEFLDFLAHRRQHGPLAIFVLSDRLYRIKTFDEGLHAPQAKEILLRLGLAARKNRPGFYDPRAASLEALKEIARSVAPIPGRKNLIWYSLSFPESILPGPLMEISTGPANPQPPAIGADGLGDHANFLEPLREVTDLLTLSHVSLYPVDVRGVVGYPGPGGSEGTYALQAMQFSAMIRNSETATMDTLADDTGGHAFYGSNDLEGSIDQAIDDGSTYYTLTYEPTNPKYDGSLRHIKVTLKQSGYNLAYRKVYYADDLDTIVPAAPKSPNGPMSAMLFVAAHLEAAGPPGPPTPEERNALSHSEALRIKHHGRAEAGSVPMQHYLVSYGLIARQLDLPEDETGARHASLEFSVVAFDKHGRELNGIDSRVDDPIALDRYAKVAADGYRIGQSIAVPVTATSLRLAVRDVTGNRTGSLEIPLPLAKPAEASTEGGKAPAK